MQRLGTMVFALIVLAIGASVALSFAMNSAADDLRGQVKIASGQQPDRPRTVVSIWLADRMATDLDVTDYSGRFNRGEELDHRADRIRELAGPAGLAGLVFMLATARVDARDTKPRSATSPVASTSNHGTV